MKIGIVGHGADKFTPSSEAKARALITTILDRPDVTCLVSGHSPMGGIDIWAEDVAMGLGLVMDIKVPRINQWNPVGGYGYKARNLDIARSSDQLNVVLVADYPPGYTGMRFNQCYHCAKVNIAVEPHVKSGGCWTGHKAAKMGKVVYFHVIGQD